MIKLITFLFLFSLNARAAGKIINADIAASGTANIARNKLAASTAHNACTFDASGFIAGGVAPGASGNILQSNGTDWASVANTAALSLGAFGSTPNANGLSLSSNVLNMQPADATNPGGLSILAQTIAGTKTFSSTISGSINGNAATVTTNANLTGPITSVGNATSVAAQTGTGSTFVMNTAPTMTNPVVGTQATSDNSTKAASTAFVQTALAQLNPAAAVVAASTANIAGTYTNAVGGVCIGDTFQVTSTSAFAPDGVTLTVGQRFLMKDQSSSFQDGVWTLTTAANVGVLGALLTRALDFDSSADISAGSIVPVVSGTVNAGSSWYQTAANSTCNTDSQTWTQFQKASSAYASSTLTNTHILVGNSSNVATDVAMSGDSSIANTGAVTVAKVNGVSYPSGPGTNTVPVVTSSNTITYEAVPNAALANSSVTVNGTTCTLGSSCSPTASTNTLDNMIYVDSGNGHGSTNTTVRRYSFVRRKIGSFITYADSATNGASFTIATGGGGDYFMCAHEKRAGAAVADVGITVNGSALTTSIATPLTFAQGVRSAAIGITNSQGTNTCIALALADADVVRVQTTTAEDGTDQNTSFMMTYIGPTGSSMYYNDGNGHGSTGTTTRKWTDARISNGGSDISYTASASNSNNGDKFTALTSGTYAICAGDSRSGGTLDTGIVINSSSNSTGVSSLTYANGKRTYMNGVSTAATTTQCLFIPLSANDVIQWQDDAGAADSTNSFSFISVIKVGSLSNFQFVDTGGGHGSVGTFRILFTTVESSTQGTDGTGITLTNDALYGTSFTAASPGIYAGCINTYTNGGAQAAGIMFNGNRIPSTSVSTIPFVDGARNLIAQGASSMSDQVCYAQYMQAGDNVGFGDNNNTTTASGLTMAHFTGITQ